MPLKTEEKKKPSGGGSSHVRFSPSEYSRILKDKSATGNSIPELLKASYFSSFSYQPLFSKYEVKALRADMQRIGNNMNQVARHLNSGLAFNWDEDFRRISLLFGEILMKLNAKLKIKDGIHKR